MNQIRLQNKEGKISLVGEIVKLAPNSTKAYVLANTPDPDAIGTVAESVPNGYWGLVNLINTVAWNDVSNPPSSIITGEFTETALSYTMVCNSATAIDLYLLEATGSFRQREVCNIGAGRVRVIPSANPSDPSNVDLIDGETYQYVNQWETMVIRDISLNTWKII